MKNTILFVLAAIIFFVTPKAYAGDEFPAKVFAEGWAAPVITDQPYNVEKVLAPPDLDLGGLVLGDSDPAPPQHSVGMNLGISLQLSKVFLLEGRGFLGTGMEKRMVTGGGGDIGWSVLPRLAFLIGGETTLERSTETWGVSASGGPGVLWNPIDILRVTFRPHVGWMMTDVEVIRPDFYSATSAEWITFTPTLSVGLTYP